MGGVGTCKLSCEHLIEALEKNRGFILAAKKWIKKTYGYDVCYSTIKKRIDEWGMQDWLNDIRKSLVEDCLQKTFAKGISEGDNHCIAWVLEKYGHHLDFLDPQNTELASMKGWKELLEIAKRVTESDSKEEPTRE